MSTFIQKWATLSLMFDIWNKSDAMTSTNCTDFISPPVTTRPTSFVTIRPTNKIQILLLFKSSQCKEVYEICIYMQTDKKANADNVKKINRIQWNKIFLKLCKNWNVTMLWKNQFLCLYSQ